MAFFQPSINEMVMQEVGNASLFIVVIVTNQFLYPARISFPF